MGFDEWGNNSTGFSGYFKTNRTGGIDEPTFADDLPSGKYIINFLDDINSDEKVDSGRTVIFKIYLYHVLIEYNGDDKYTWLENSKLEILNLSLKGI